ncbi:TetR/AcrR family transcriptional regulator [Nocardiopsis sp. RSe5-2]|uniref:TetR/AcrR family transcriptional regulator n=1 Tax=Nocardiopsis endophytica TaxID=3018445 RepID=A0ABT4U653_9ACTN|nr:TetR/AcrR family transcriptional regulator [Nocardiopsis endophytica]MDA2812415.1 TetR/AcrR family transcriptional regulator [Nocardiopsis endophytica]
MTRATSRRPGGRTARNTAAVLEATLAELGGSGYADLTVERVAARSGVHKATIYRRWGGVDELLAAALEQADHDSWTPPDTGSLESDLRALGEEVAAGFSSDDEEGSVATATIAAAFQSPAAAEALRAFMEERLRRCAEVVERAERRGEVPEGTDAAEVVRAAVAPVYFRLFISREEGAGQAAARAARVAAEAAKAGEFRGSPPGR